MALLSILACTTAGRYSRAVLEWVSYANAGVAHMACSLSHLRWERAQPFQEPPCSTTPGVSSFIFFKTFSWMNLQKHYNFCTKDVLERWRNYEVTQVPNTIRKLFALRQTQWLILQCQFQAGWAWGSLTWCLSTALAMLVQNWLQLEVLSNQEDTSLKVWPSSNPQYIHRGRQ